MWHSLEMLFPLLSFPLHLLGKHQSCSHTKHGLLCGAFPNPSQATVRNCFSPRFTPYLMGCSSSQSLCNVLQVCSPYKFL